MFILHKRETINAIHYSRIVIVCLVSLICLIVSHESQATTSHDLHYTKVGFFDIHVCNWPDRPLFFLALFSTYDFNNISNIKIYTPKNTLLGELDLTKYRLISEKNKKEKRVFIKQFEISAKATNGWYYTKVHLKDGNTITAKDYVIIDKLAVTKILTPDITKELKTIPKSFSWEKITGAQHYQAFIYDRWDTKLIYTSDMSNKTKIDIPANLLKKGGLYTIQIHARDTNEHKLLGDFNHGSLTPKVEFSIAE